MATTQAEAAPQTLLTDLHVSYIQSLDKVRPGSPSLARQQLPLTEFTLRHQDQDSLSYLFTEHLRMNGVYWGLTALAFMGRMDALPRDEMIRWVMSCWHEDVGAYSLCAQFEVALMSVAGSAGGFAPHPGHEPHIHSTLSAVQILAMQDSLDVLNKDKIVACERSPYSSQ